MLQWQPITINQMAKKSEYLQSVTGLSRTDLEAKIREDEQRLKKLGFAHAVAPLENPQSIRSLRRDIARLKTLLKQKQAEA